MRRARSIRLKFLTKSHESEREGFDPRIREGRSTSGHRDVEDRADEISSRLAREWLMMTEKTKLREIGRTKWRTGRGYESPRALYQIGTRYERCFALSFWGTLLKDVPKIWRGWKSDCLYARILMRRASERERGRKRARKRKKENEKDREVEKKSKRGREGTREWERERERESLLVCVSLSGCMRVCMCV